MGPKRSRGTEKAKIFVALSLDKRGNPLYLKMRVTQDIKKGTVKEFAQSAFQEGSTIRSDGYCNYIPALEDFTYEHASYDPNSKVLRWLHIAISNAKAFILGTYHGLPKYYLQSYLAEYCFHFSRRSCDSALVDRLALAVCISVRLS